MADKRTADFNRCFKRLDSEIRKATRSAYKDYLRDEQLVNFRQKGRLKNIPHYGAEINDNYRALALRRNGHTYWYWVGLHTDYDRILKSMGLKK